MRKLIVITSILFMAVIAASIWYFARIRHNNGSQNGSLTHIPADAAFLVSFQNDKSFYNIFNDYKIFEALIGKETQHELNYLNKYLLKVPEFADLTNKQTIYFSFHPNKDQISWLLTIPFNIRTSPEESAGILAKNMDGIGEIIPDTMLTNTFRIKLNEFKTPFFIAFKEGSVFFSHNQLLISQAINDKASHLSPAFLQELAKNGHKNNNSIFNLHLNHSELFKFVSNLTRTKAGNNIQLLEGLQGMSSLNMNFKSDALMFSGISTIDNAASAANYLAIYAYQQATDSELKQILPSNTAAYVSFAFSDYAALHKQLVGLLNKRNQLNRINDQLKLINSSKKFNVDSALLAQWDDEFASIELNTRENIGIVKLKDSIIFEETIAKISSATTENIRRFDNSNLLYYSFGDPMLPFQRPYFTVVGNYLICANTISTLQQFRKQYTEKQLLTNTIPFIEFSKLQSNKSNVTFFLQNENAKSNLTRTLKPLFGKAYTDTMNFDFKNFYGLSYQLTGYNGSFYSNFSAKYISPESAAVQAEWDANLSSEISYAPTVWKYNDTTNFVITQDKSDRIYAFSTEGKELWRNTLSGKIQGEIRQLSDNSILFNTTERLYRFMPNGSSFTGFPIVLPFTATDGSTFYDIEGNNAKIFIPAGQHILAFDKSGKELKEWHNKTVDSPILYDLKCALLDDFNYIIALTKSGEIHLFNHNGSLVSVMNSEKKSEFKNTFGVEITPGDPAASRIITTDTSGMLISTYFDKKQSQTSLGNWSENHFFTTRNVQGDSIPELIFTDKNQLYTYSSKDSSLLFNHTFNSAISASPLFFPSENKRFTLGIATDAKLLYAFETDGSIVKGFPIEGYPAFYYGKLKNNGHRYLLLSKDGRTLSAYKLD